MMKRRHGGLMSPLGLAGCSLALALLCGGCAVSPKPGLVDAPDTVRLADNPVQSPWALGSALAGVVSVWEHQHFPGKTASHYRYVYNDGRHALRAQTQASASLFRKKIRLPALALGEVQFSWKVPALIANADMALREADDSPVRLVLVFEGDRSKFSMKNAMLSELAHSMTGEPMPYATLMYVWCNTRAPGSVIINPRTDRIRKLVVESGAGRLNQWLDYKRDIAADFEQAFGEPPGALLGIGIMTDTDNTRSNAHAWYGPVTLTKR